MTDPADAIEAWHFVGATLRDGRPVPADGVVLMHDGPVEVCFSGYHGSERIIDALKYAPGSTICRVRVWGDVQREDDKIVGRFRVIDWRVDGEALLQTFARRQALSVVHLWNAPPIVRDWLETGEEKTRNAAWIAARDAALNAARDAAWAAAGAAAGAAAKYAAKYAAKNAARAAAKAAARAAAWTAPWGAVKAAARDAMNDAANDMLMQMVMEARDE